MSSPTDKEVFQNFYAATPPWDIGRPQQPFIDAADRIAGSILDAGCGTGETALYLAQRGNQVTGIDFVEQAIREARRKATERGLAVNFLIVDALALGAIPQQFDNVVDSGLFHCFNDADRVAYVAGLASVVRSGGRLFLMCFRDDEPGDTGPRRVSRAELEAAFASGWTIESITPCQFQVTPEYAPNFTPGGPKAWFAVMRRA